MPQLTSMAIHIGVDLYLRWPYQAKVIKTLEMARRMTVNMHGTSAKGLARHRRRSWTDRATERTGDRHLNQRVTRPMTSSVASRAFAEPRVSIRRRGRRRAQLDARDLDLGWVGCRTCEAGSQIRL